MFDGMIAWCNYKGFPWKIVNNSFFWQTNYQTGEQHIDHTVYWHDYNYFTTI